MATTAAAVTPPLLKPEMNPSAVSPGPQEIIPIVDQYHPSNTPTDSTELKIPTPAVPSPPLFMNTIDELRGLSAAINAFKDCYDDLLNHLDTIKAAITSTMPPKTARSTLVAPLLSTLPRETQTAPSLSELPLQAPVSPSSSELPLETPTTPLQSKLVLEAPLPSNSENHPPETSPKPDLSEERVLLKEQKEQDHPESEIEGFCKIMCSRGLRKYLVTHLSDLPKLRDEVPMALKKWARNPPKLVLECLGKFYLQGKKAYTRNSPMIGSRDASIFILECFLRMMGLHNSVEVDNGVFDIEKEVREEAEHAALAWRKRLVYEGGIVQASQIDARGLLMFVACFGVPASFKRKDIRDLVIVGNAKEIMDVLKNSQVLMNKIPDIVEGMIKKKMEINAVDIACTFGLEGKFDPQTILQSFLHEFNESLKKSKKGSLGSPATLNEANKKQLAALKSLKSCLERHNLDPAKLLSGFQINEKIATLDKEIADFNKKSGDRPAHKRKASEAETSKRSKTQESKRSRYIGHGSQQQSTPSHVDNRRRLLDSGVPSHANHYSAQPVLYGGHGAGLLPVSTGMLLSDDILSRNHYAGVHNGVLVDRGTHVINHNSHHHPYVWHRNSGINERFPGQPSSVGLTNLYSATPSMEGFAGTPNASSGGGGSRGSAADLYQFADSVVERESYPPSGVVQSVGEPYIPSGVGGAAANGAPAYHSYVYHV